MNGLFYFGKAFTSKLFATAFAAGAVSGVVGYHQQRFRCTSYREKRSLIQINSKLLIPGRGDPIKDGIILIEGKTILYAGSRHSCDVSIDDFNVEQTVDVPVVMPGIWFYCTPIIAYYICNCPSEQLKIYRKLPFLLKRFNHIRNIL